MHTREEKLKAFGRLLDVLDELREKCPWDRKQTNESLRPNTIEETFELCDALIKNDEPNICKELGDVLLHVCFYAKIGQENEQFDIADVCNKLVDKLIFRHPHVYHPSQVGVPEPKPLPYGEDIDEQDTSEEVKTAQQVIENWEQIKLREKDGNKRVLSGVPDALPALSRLIVYRIRHAMLDLIGKTKVMCGERCVRNLANWKPRFERKIKNVLPKSLATSFSRSLMQHVRTR